MAIKIKELNYFDTKNVRFITAKLIDIYNESFYF